MIFAVALLGIASFLARHYLRERRGLRLVFLGLFTAGVAGVAISFSPLVIARFLSALMLMGVVMMVRGIDFEKKLRR